MATARCPEDCSDQDLPRTGVVNRLRQYCIFNSTQFYFTATISAIIMHYTPNDLHGFRKRVSWHSSQTVTGHRSLVVNHPVLAHLPSPFSAAASPPHRDYRGGGDCSPPFHLQSDRESPDPHPITEIEPQIYVQVQTHGRASTVKHPREPFFLLVATCYTVCVDVRKTRRLLALLRLLILILLFLILKRSQ